MKREDVKKAISWFGILIATHLAGMIAFGIFLSSSLTAMAEKQPQTVSVSIFLFDIAFQILFSVMFVNIETSFVEYRRKLREALREPAFSLIEYFKQKHLKGDLVRIVIFAVFQIPIMIFFASFKFSLLAITGLERFYIMDVGAYLLTNSAILGVLLNSLIFGVIYLSIRLASLALLKKRL